MHIHQYGTQEKTFYLMKTVKALRSGLQAMGYSVLITENQLTTAKPRKINLPSTLRSNPEKFKCLTDALFQNLLFQITRPYHLTSTGMTSKDFQAKLHANEQQPGSQSSATTKLTGKGLTEYFKMPTSIMKILQEYMIGKRK